MPAVIQPRDRTKTEHYGLLDKVIWADADKPVSILALTDGLKVVVDAPPGEFVRGQKYRFLGRWEEGPRGPQFVAGTFVRDQPHSKSGVVAYLTRECEGVGERTAEKLWTHYGPGAVKKLREDPAGVAADGVMSAEAARDAARDLARLSSLEGTKVDLFGLVAGRGFPRKVVEHAVSKWGTKAPEIIRACPYRLLTARLPGCGWKRCDKLYLDLGKRRDALKRQALAGGNALREDRTGSTWLPAQLVVTAIKDAVPAAANPVKAIKLGIRAGLFSIRRDGAARWIASAGHARSEQRVVDSVRRLLTAQSEWPRVIPVSKVDGDGLPSEHQAGELTKATAATVGCLTGGPGTGKTHTLSFALRAIIAAAGEQSVAVVAPTGKAADRATQSLAARGIGIRATTIHRLLEIGRNGHDGSGWGFVRNRDNPLDERFFVVDETSMVDASLMADFLDAVPTGGHVLFVGDPFQLPPVGHGAPLRDMLAAGVAQGELTEVRRNAGLIVEGCRAIKAGQRPQTAARFDLDAASPINLRFLECRPEQTLDQIESVLDAMQRFDPVWDAQVLVATNEKSDVSRRAVNARLWKLLNPDGRRAADIPFAAGDKVICTKNSKLRPAKLIGKLSEPWMYADAGYYQTDDEGEAFVANGEIGRVAAVGKAGMVVTSGDKAVWVAKSKKRTDDDDDAGGSAQPSGGMGDWEHAYAVTTHKSQGSEWPVVIIVADKAGGGVADRNWWYTAISRASKACLIVGDRAAFDAQCRRQTLTHRKTFLAEMLTAARPDAGSST